MLPSSRILAFAAILAGAAIVACSSSSSTPGDAGAPTTCDVDPWQCAAGQTCWPKDVNLNFTCLNSGQGKINEPCLFTAGQATCGDNLACLQLFGQAMGTCTPYCDNTKPTHSCPNGG